MLQQEEFGDYNLVKMSLCKKLVSRIATQDAQQRTKVASQRSSHTRR
jgi:hypothetical protein